MLLEIPKNFPDFALLDTGDGYRLERWGEVILQRPDPQIIWPKSLADSEWQKAWAIFKSGSDEERGKWEIKKSIPDPWILTFNQIKFLLNLSPFKHTGLFAEQAAQWEWLGTRIKNKELRSKNGGNSGSDNLILNSKFKILNLFAYTGGATMVLAKAGCQVTHVDASKPAITWANENYKLNFSDVGEGLKPSPTGVRWILDDAVKFVKRELKRGAKYDGIIMDPPAFGHGPSGKTWKFNRDLPELLSDCVQLLSPDAKFLIINGYATNSSALSLNNVLQDASKNLGGKIEFGELCLKQKTGRMISTGIFARWST